MFLDTFPLKVGVNLSLPLLICRFLLLIGCSFQDSSFSTARSNGKAEGGRAEVDLERRGDFQV